MISPQTQHAGRTSYARTLGAVVLVTALLASGTSPAASPSETATASSERQPYNGAFHGPEAHLGYGWSDGRPVGSGQLGFRHSFVFLLGDTRLTYAFDDVVSEEGPDRHGLWLQTCLHPAAVVILGSDWWAYTLSSPYIELGLGGLAYVGDVADGASPAVGWSIGGGIDIPLANPDLCAAPWLYALYRHRVDATNRGAPDLRPRAHLLLLGIGWRINGTLF